MAGQPRVRAARLLERYLSRRDAPTVTDLARRTGIVRTNFGRIIRGQHRVTFEQAAALEDVTDGEIKMRDWVRRG